MVTLTTWVHTAARGLFWAGLVISVVSSRDTRALDRSPLCRVTLRVEPDPAWTGQAVDYRVRILRRDDVTSLKWDPAPFFPDLRAEWIPGRSGDDPVLEGGDRYRIFEERRVLFAARTGLHEIPPAGLRCRSAGAPGTEEIVPVPGATLRVREPPEAGRPAEWSGLVGVVRVVELVEPRQLALGESVRISALIEGEASVWNVRPPFAGDDPIPGAEVFPRKPETARDSGRRLRMRRYFVYDVVPRRQGSLRIPEIWIPYFDPELAEYRVAHAPAVTVEVGAPRPRTQTHAVRPGRKAMSDPPEARSFASRAGALVAVGLLALGAGLAVWAWRRSRTGGTWQEIESLLTEAERADLPDSDRLACHARALRIALDATDTDEASRHIPETSETPGRRAAAQLLSEIERARFSLEPRAPTSAGVREVLRVLREEHKLLSSS